jgi:myo-inositol 2-dehydrogenase / D-chiro-inositol 1-dehydrogenase
MDKIRLAVIGAGGQCTASLMPGIPYIGEIDLVAICDLKRELAERNARSFGARAVYTDFEQMLRDEKPDAAMVIGPPQMHEEIGIAVLQSGCHLFIEKPASPTIEGAKRLVDAAEAAGKIGQVGHMMRHADPIRVAWDIAHAEEFGDIVSVESKYTTWPTGTIGPGQGWGEPDADWTYMLVQGGHPTDLIRHFLGPIVRVAGRKRQGKDNAKVYQVAVESAEGRVGFLNLQDSYNGWTTKLEVVGDALGIVTVDDLGRVQYRRGERRVPVEAETVGNTAYVWEAHHRLTAWQRCGYGNQLRHFARCIIEGKRPYPSLWDGWRNLVVTRCIVESCATNRMVDVPQ